MFQLTRPSLLTCALPAVLVTAMLPTTGEAEVVEFSASSYYRTQDSNNSAAGGDASNQIPPSGPWVGWHSNGNRFRTVATFDLTNFDVPLADIESVKLSFYVEDFPNSSTNFTHDIEVWALGSQGSNVVVPSDYERIGTLAYTFDDPDELQTITTENVKASLPAGSLEGDFVAFRLQLPSSLAITGAHTGYYVSTPTLIITTVPEPASVALLGLGSLCLIRRRAQA